MTIETIKCEIERAYRLRVDELNFIRESGSVAYELKSGGRRCFLRVLKPAFPHASRVALDVQLCLEAEGFPVTHIVRTTDGSPLAKTAAGALVLYDFVDGAETEPERDAEEVGELVGRMHRLMRGYSGELPACEREYYIDRYLSILRAKNYVKADRFVEIGGEAWRKVENLPRGFCHGDLYSGNTMRTDGGVLLLDFDTACRSFPMYDAMVYCNRTNYFDFEPNGREKSHDTLEKFLKGYRKHAELSAEEIAAFDDFVTIYHFAVQANVIESFGLDCVDGAFFDRQLNWLERWVSGD